MPSSGREFAGGSSRDAAAAPAVGAEGRATARRRVGEAYLAELRKAAGAAVRFAKPRSIRSLALLLPTATDFPAVNTARAAVEGAIIADFDSDTYRSDRKDRSLEVGHAAGARRRGGARVQVRTRRGRDYRRGAELRPRAGQRAGQRADADRARPTRGGNGQGERPRLRGLLHRQAEGAEDGRLLGVAQGSAEPPR